MAEMVDEEIEKYLLEKLDHAINKHDASDTLFLWGKFASFQSEFNELKELLRPETNPSQPNWKRIRRENLYHLNNVVNEWQMISKKHNSFSITELYGAHENIKKSLKKIKKELKGEEASGRGAPERTASHHQDPNLPIFERNREEVTYRWSSRHGPPKVHGLEDKSMAMERELLRGLPGAFTAVGVVGVAGIGKTALCQTIFSRQKVKESFCPRIWVCLSKQPREDPDNKKEIVVRILKCLGVEDEAIDAAKDVDDSPLQRLIFLLRLQLRGKKYLIVLDDAWNDDKFFENLTQRERLEANWGEELAYGLPKGSGGSVILSSRSEALAKKMIGENATLQYLKPLTDENCGEIFKDTVVGFDEDRRELPEYLKDLKGEILKKCAGLPLAAKLIGQIAREQLPPEKEKPPTTVSAGAGGGQEIKHDGAGGSHRHQNVGGVDEEDQQGGEVQDNKRKGEFKNLQPQPTK